MAEMFYSLEETMHILKINEAGLNELVANGLVREFRDGYLRIYKRDEVNQLQNSAPNIISKNSSSNILNNPLNNNSFKPLKVRFFYHTPYGKVLTPLQDDINMWMKEEKISAQNIKHILQSGTTDNIVVSIWYTLD
ncbi:MAG: hypothetical protein ACP5OG_02355 [Candidatus Nanoarchaeia archaeon]